MSALEKAFKLKELGTNVRIEVIAGVTTFMTMAYIIFVNPAILSAGGVPFKGAAIATCIVSGMITIMMGLFTNYPLALAAGMGLNAIVAYDIVLGMGQTWQIGMGVVVIEGTLVLILSFTNIRTWVMEAIPQELKYAIGVGIGLFIAFIGLHDGGIIVDNPVTLVSLGDLTKSYALITLIGLVITAVFVVLRIPGALLLGIFVTAIIAAIPPFSLLSKPEGIIDVPRDFSTMFAFDILGAAKLALIPVIFAFFMTDFFDTMGTAIGIGEKAGFLDENGHIPKLRNLLVVDSMGAVSGGLLGCSSVTSYIESAAGVSAGGRSGLTAIVTGICFLLSLLFIPVVALIGGGVHIGEAVFKPVTSPVLIIVGFLMVEVIRKIDFAKVEVALPAFLIIIMMPLTYSITYGIGFGFVSYSLIKLLTGEGREVHPLMYAVSILFAVCFVIPWITKLITSP